MLFPNFADYFPCRLCYIASSSEVRMRSLRKLGFGLLVAGFALPAQALCTGNGLNCNNVSGGFNSGGYGNNYGVQRIDGGGGGGSGITINSPSGPIVLHGGPDISTVNNPGGGTTTTIPSPVPIPVPGSTTGATTIPVTTSVNTPTSHVVTTSGGTVINLPPDSQRWRLDHQTSGNIDTYTGRGVDGRPFRFVCNETKCTGSN
jgi:hypothetical protein